MSLGLDAIGYAETARMYAHFRLLFGDAQALKYLLGTPGLTGAQLTAWLATPANLAAFQQLVAAPHGAAAVCASGTAMAAIAGSATAMQAMVDAGEAAHTAMAGSKTALTAIAGNATATSILAGSAAAFETLLEGAQGIRVLAGSGTAMGVLTANGALMNRMLAKSGDVRAVLYDGTTAWNAIAASTAAKAAMLAVSAEHKVISSAANPGHAYPPGCGPGVRAVLLTQWTSNNQYASYAGAGADTYVTVSSTPVDRYLRVTGLTHRSDTNSSWGSNIKYLVMQ